MICCQDCGADLKTMAARARGRCSACDNAARCSKKAPDPEPFIETIVHMLDQGWYVEIRLVEDRSGPPNAWESARPVYCVYFRKHDHYMAIAKGRDCDLNTAIDKAVADANAIERDRWTGRPQASKANPETRR